MPFLDCGRLESIANELDDHAEAIRGLTSRLRARAEHLEWRSPAAKAFGESLTGVLAVLSTCQGRCWNTAAAVRHHQATAAHHLAIASSVERTVVDVAHAVWEIL